MANEENAAKLGKPVVEESGHYIIGEPIGGRRAMEAGDFYRWLEKYEEAKSQKAKAWAAEDWRKVNSLAKEEKEVFNNILHSLYCAYDLIENPQWDSCFPRNLFVRMMRDWEAAGDVGCRAFYDYVKERRRDARIARRKLEEQEQRRKEREQAEAKRKREERIAEKGRLVFAVECAVKNLDAFCCVVCSIFCPLALVYIPVRLLLIGIGKLAVWIWREASDEATRGVKALRTKARDFEAATRPE